MSTAIAFQDLYMFQYQAQKCRVEVNIDLKKVSSPADCFKKDSLFWCLSELSRHPEDRSVLPKRDVQALMGNIGVTMNSQMSNWHLLCLC